MTNKEKLEKMSECLIAMENLSPWSLGLDNQALSMMLGLTDEVNALLNPDIDLDDESKETIYNYYYCIPTYHKYRFTSTQYIDDLGELLKESSSQGVEPEIEDSVEDWVILRDGVSIPQ